MKTKIGLSSATALVISAMVGTGVYTSLGFQVLGVQSIIALLLLWLIGGLVALCGSLVYGEIGSVLQGSGGEYNYLSKLYHPIVGFMSGFVSATVGFAAPVALSSMAFGRYICTFFPELSSLWIATTLIIIVSIVQLTGIKPGAVFQKYCTVINLCLILTFVVFGLISGPYPSFDHTFGLGNIDQVFTSSFAISLVYVSYSYSGWNSSAYIAGEIDNPQRNLPLSLFGGTAVVTLLYLVLNFIFLYNVPIQDLAGKVEVGYVAAQTIFGLKGGSIVSALIALGLLASVNAMSMVGPRLTKAIAEDFTTFKIFTKENKSGNPYVSQLMLTVIALTMVHTSTFENVLTYIGFTLSLFTGLVVAGIFILRKRFSDHRGFRTWFYPVTPLFFLFVDGWMILYVFKENMVQSLAGLLTAGLGAVVYLINYKYKTNRINI